MNTLTVAPRETPAERADTPVDIDVDEALATHAALLEDWVTPRQNWTLLLREGHEFGRKAGAAPGYSYSPALLGADLTWSADSLDRWRTAKAADYR